MELVEKLGRKDPCPCGSGRRFQQLLHVIGPVSTAPGGVIIGAEARTALMRAGMVRPGAVPPRFTIVRRRLIGPPPKRIFRCADDVFHPSCATALHPDGAVGPRATPPSMTRAA
ncbi:SEC-C metal-binding domain-containing protein [Sphingomonas cavernae]|uniref:SEC-C metal-binding domain-containing protein n=1 Tax=Sphingomonas cavernae TaxID=2320861 RepID=UPI003B75C662